MHKINCAAQLSGDGQKKPAAKKAKAKKQKEHEQD